MDSSSKESWLLTAHSRVPAYTYLGQQRTNHSPTFILCQALGSVLIFRSEPQIKAWKGPGNLCNVNPWLWLALNLQMSSSPWLQIALIPPSLLLCVLYKDQGSLCNLEWLHTRQPPVPAS